MNLCQRILLIYFLLIATEVVSSDAILAGSKLQADEVSRRGLHQIDWRRFRVPASKDRKLVRDWIMEIRTRSMMFDRLAVDVTGEKYIGAKVDGNERVVARRFAFTWAVDHKQDRERVIFADQSLLEEATKNSGQSYLLDSHASSYDQLRIKNWFHGATGKQVHPPSRSKSLNARFRLCGVFDPICATTGSVISIATGNAFERNRCQLHEKNMIGIYRQQELTIAAFEYQPVPESMFVRVAFFRHAVPVQVDDFLSLGTDLHQILELGDRRGPEELQLLKKIVKPYARTTSVWSSTQGVQLPVRLFSLTLGGEQSFEVKAKFEWRIGRHVPASVFDAESLGGSAPLVLSSGPHEPH